MCHGPKKQKEARQGKEGNQLKKFNLKELSPTEEVYKLYSIRTVILPRGQVNWGFKCVPAFHMCGDNRLRS